LIYALNVAKLFEATLLLDGGLILGSTENIHSGSSIYNKVADILGIRFLGNFTQMNERFGPLKELSISFPDIVALSKGLHNSSLQLHCRTIIRSDIGSCKGGWCPVVYPGHNFVKEVNWLLRNNTAKKYCNESNLGNAYISTCEFINLPKDINQLRICIQATKDIECGLACSNW